MIASCLVIVLPLMLHLSSPHLVALMNVAVVLRAGVYSSDDGADCTENDGSPGKCMARLTAVASTTSPGVSSLTVSAVSTSLHLVVPQAVRCCHVTCRGWRWPRGGQR
jgi:hypothetical protein